MEATHDKELNELNTKTVNQLVPAFVYIAVLMVVGTVGNTLVCYFYGFKTKRSPHIVFIIYLAMFDLLGCLFTMPTEITDHIYFYNSKSSPLCKGLIFINFFGAFSSGSTLVAIAIDRYRMLCRPMTSTLTLRRSRRTCFVIAVISIVFTWPALVLFNIVPVSLRYSDSLNITGYDCTLQTEGNYSIFSTLYTVILILVFLGFIFTLITMYSKIGHTINSLKKSNTRLDTESVKFTMIMITVTAAFILSFLPYFTLQIWIGIVGKDTETTLNGSALVAYRIGGMSYLFNNVANPFIYGFFNSEFRTFSLQLCHLCKRQKSRDLSDTEHTWTTSHSHDVPSTTSI